MRYLASKLMMFVSFILEIQLSRCSVGKFGLQVGKMDGQVGIFGLQVGKITFQVGIIKICKLMLGDTSTI